ncbi:hypothetical protein MW388_003165 [Acinetobacter baumannii]|nr:hypothetical protein [Acinetobacter baumannii]
MFKKLSFSCAQSSIVSK